MDFAASSFHWQVAIIPFLNIELLRPEQQQTVFCELDVLVLQFTVAF